MIEFNDLMNFVMILNALEQELRLIYFDLHDSPFSSPSGPSKIYLQLLKPRSIFCIFSHMEIRVSSQIHRLVSKGILNP